MNTQNPHKPKYSTVSTEEVFSKNSYYFCYCSFHLALLALDISRCLYPAPQSRWTKGLDLADQPRTVAGRFSGNSNGRLSSLCYPPPSAPLPRCPISSKQHLLSCQQCLVCEHWLSQTSYGNSRFQYAESLSYCHCRCRIVKSSHIASASGRGDMTQ